ncbi:membrane transporter [Vararia minispora EC-137]|uniref:Membrane transporter n=1 Tax=Vararia minispora EC-137 TaxID=1314806 RepID=A0ACB8QUH3_9AGAM|nr:membrane transporter [Vararia minispora EC-137]
MRSLVITILQNVMAQISLFIIVSSGSEYAKFLGGTETFSGLVLGIPLVFAGFALIPMVRYDGGSYKLPLLFACVASIFGTMLYGLAYKARFLYLILISRIVLGLSFISFMYNKRYCSDSRVVGMRRRTTLASWLVVGQATGFAVGPFAGGLLYKIGFGSEIFNGYTSPGWVMCGLWVAFSVVAALLFEDVPRNVHPTISNLIPLQPISDTPSKEQVTEIRRSFEEEPGRPDMITPDPSVLTPPPENYKPSWRQWGVIATMCWFAMTCFFVLGAWEANIPIYTAHAFGSSPFAAGNLIALGGLCTFPLLLANVRLARRMQDRHILAGGSMVGFIGLVVALGLLASDMMTYWTLFACWLFVAFGFNIATTVTVSLLSKQMPYHWNSRTSLFIQYSNYTGRVTGAVWGGAGVNIGMVNFVGLEIALLGMGVVMFMTFWRELKTKTG